MRVGRNEVALEPLVAAIRRQALLRVGGEARGASKEASVAMVTMCDTESPSLHTCTDRESPTNIGPTTVTSPRVCTSFVEIAALPMAGCIAYGGKGFSQGVLHMLEGAPRAAYCLPEVGQSAQSPQTWELDHLLAIHFQWWDVLVGAKKSL